MERKPFPSETQERFIVRFPDGMRDRIAEEAKKNNRSMNAEIVARLEKSFNAHHTSPELIAELERLFDEKLGHQAYIDRGDGGRMEDVKIVKRPKG